MEAVPAAEALDGHKDRFDLGVFVGDLALDEELTRYSRSRRVISPSFYDVAILKLGPPVSSLLVTTSPWRGCSRSSTTARMTRYRRRAHDFCAMLCSSLRLAETLEQQGALLPFWACRDVWVTRCCIRRGALLLITAVLFMGMSRRSRTSWPTASSCASTQKASRITYAKSSWIPYRSLLWQMLSVPTS